MHDEVAGPTCRVIAVNDGSILCSGLFQALADNAMIDVVGIDHDNWRVVELVGRIDPDVIIILAGGGTPALIRQLRGTAGVSTAVLVVGDSGPLVAESVLAGACGTISPGANATDVSLAVMAAMAGTAVPPVSLVGHLAASPRWVGKELIRLSNREMEVMQRATEGLTNSSIARSLSLSEATVKTYWRRIFRKLDAHDRTMAVTIAIKLGILPQAGHRPPADHRPAAAEGSPRCTPALNSMSA
ncbi:helix-turn-helix transcriptional regulator [Amycolatopsis magusensis]|uniref:DNA-binding NarL/FixJ family response regulator n=1 Tax=Amycolatopsis magusensis TaxID=882444 RepID=A0ABS4PXS1_9PSEU|nr:response regulator transcription factor [Amycolatopsis magusensis]MBP2184229.1 DNA-binding NarL/FixJ family response regulator [Amycolatopsis magusensis]